MALDLVDKTANAMTLTNDGAVEYTASLPFAGCTTAADFEAGETDILTIDDNAPLSITGDMTLETWANFESTPTSGNAMNLIAKFHDAAGAKYSYIWQLRNVGGTLRSWANYSANGSSPTPIAVDWTPSTATWYHMAVSFTAASKEWKFYIDGAQRGLTQIGATTTIADTTAPFTIGGWQTTLDPMDGKLTDVRVWNVVRTETEIDDNKDVHLTGSETGLVAYWPFHELAGGAAPRSTAYMTPNTRFWGM